MAKVPASGRAPWARRRRGGGGARSPRWPWCPLAGGLHGLAVVLGLEVGSLGHQKRLIGHVRLEPGLAKDRAVALLFELEREVSATGLDDATLGEDVDHVGLDMVQ